MAGKKEINPTFSVFFMLRCGGLTEAAKAPTMACLP